MHVISVVTAIRGPSLPHLAAAYRSLAGQELPPDWAWEWLVQLSGAAPDVPAEVLADERVSVGRNDDAGPGATRNATLARASGELVKVLDADDLLAPGALMRDVKALRTGVEWTTSSVLDLMPDGSTVGFAADPAHGLLRRWSVVEHWRTHDHRLPVHPGTLCIRRELIDALGGWMSMPASQDTGLMLSANVVADGFFTADVGLYYRKWPDQVTVGAAHHDPVQKRRRIQLIERRLQALAGP